MSKKHCPILYSKLLYTTTSWTDILRQIYVQEEVTYHIKWVTTSWTHSIVFVNRLTIVAIGHEEMLANGYILYFKEVLPNFI